jgi:hypothetical protein
MKNSGLQPIIKKHYTAFSVMFALMLTGTFHSSAQNITNYAYTASSGSFTTLSGATSPALSAGNTDDGYFNNLPIGFEFFYMGNRYNTVSASTNGWLSLGAAITGSETGNNLTSGGLPRPVIAPLWDDLDIQSAGNFSYNTTGAAGSRVFTAQYLNVLWNYSSILGASISFQAKLYEGSGRVEFVYERVTILGLGLFNPSASIGISGTSTGSGNFLSLNGAGTGPAASSTAETTNIGARPANGQTYRFTPLATPPAAPTALTFTGVTSNNMVLNWTDNSANESGFLIYRSTDGVTYTYSGRVTSNTTTYSIPPLAPNTTYYWRIYAITEAALSTPLTGSRATCWTLSTIGTSGLIANYKFNGNANDENFGNQGTLQNAPTPVADRFGNANSAFNFNGTNQYVSTTNAYTNPSVFSYSLWFNTTTTTGGKIINFGQAQTGGSGNYDRQVYMSNNGTLNLSINPAAGTTISSPLAYNDGNWHLLSVTVGASGMRLYVDASLVASNAATGGQNFTGYWRIGYDNLGAWPNTPTSAFFRGTIDDVYIFHRELSSTEITTLYNSPEGIGSNSPVCNGGTLNLTSTAIASATYSWTGPNSFSSSSQNPNVTAMSTVKEGVYAVTVTAAGCNATGYTTAKINYNLGPAISQIPASGLLHRYKFDGNANDENATNHGSLQNTPTLTTDRFGIANRAYAFNGSSQYMTSNLTYTNPNDLSFSLWFRTNTSQGGRLIGLGASQTGASSTYDRHLYMNNAGQLYFGVNPTPLKTVQTTASYNDSLWHHVVATLSSTAGIRLYVDGVLIGTDATATSGQAGYNGYVRVGYDNVTGWPSAPSSAFFNGSIDDILIYNRALNSTEVTTLYISPGGAGNNGPVCAGTTLSLSATTIGGAAYAWTGPNSFSSSAQNPTLTYASAYTGTYTLTVTQGGCTSVAYTNAAPKTSGAGQWIGGFSNDWATLDNWCSIGLPTATTDVVIAAGAVNMPTAAGSVFARNLTINTSASLTLSATGLLNLYGNFTNNGTFSDVGSYTSNSGILFTGSTAQSITGATTFNNLTLNNTNGLTLNNAATINGILNLTAGTFTTNNLLNQNLYTGAIAGTGSGATTGNINFFKTIWGDRYHYISSPIGGLTASAWNDDVTIKFGANRNLFAYNEAVADTNKLVGWDPFTTVSTGLTSMAGYALFFPRWIYNTMIDVSGPYSHSTTYSNSSLTNTASTKPTSDGWNLIGNPYPSNIDWNAASGWTKTGLDNAIYTWDGRTNRFTSYVAGVGTNGGTRYIGSMQGFFIKVSNPGTGTLGMNNNVRVTSTLHDVWRTEESDADKILRINAQNGELSDETIIRFSHDATTNFDSEKDAHKILNAEHTPSFFSLSPGTEYAINSLPLDIVSKSIPLQLNIALAGDYKLTSDLSDFTGDEIIFLEDRLLGITQNLKESNSYTVHLPVGEHTGRFFIQYYKENNVTSTQTTQAHSTLEIAAAQQTVFVLFNDQSTILADIAIFDALGKQIYANEQTPVLSGKINIQLPGIETGIYVVKVHTTTVNKTQQVYINK